MLVITGSYTIVHAYPLGTNPQNYTAFYASGSRWGYLNNNAYAFYNISTQVNVNQRVTNSKGISVLNNRFVPLLQHPPANFIISPVAGMLPIVTVYSSTSSTFQIPAFDREGQTLSFSRSSPVEMGSINSTQPPQLTVSSSGKVTFNTNGVSLGYWSTQIKVSDGYSFVVVDFIILVIVCTIINVHIALT